MMETQYFEILAPAGGPEALRAAVFAGADAVYLGGPAFGARANAKNFSRQELADAVAFCHGRGVRVHVTVNTLLKENELPQALEFVEFLCSLPVDAVLVQDMGLFAALRQRAPELPLHASTQMSLHTPAGAKLLWALGAQRVVLSREMSLEEIREVRESCPVELESFVHGALCMSVSGQCYFSAMLGGRSGNRGLCAQPCRLPFAAPGGTGHDLSLKDLSFVREIGQLKQAGVCSAKIEGRMKRPEYVAAAVSACRRAADGEEVPQKLLSDLEAVFSRSGFTKGYLTGQRGKAMFGVRTKEDVTGATEKVFFSLRGLYRGELPRIPVDLELSQEQDQLILTVRDREGRRFAVSAPGGEGLSPLGKDRCVQQLSKTGGTPFRAENVTVPEEGVVCGVSTLNALRREALEKLLALREKREPIPFTAMPLDFPAHPRREGELPLRAQFRKAEQLCPQARKCREIVLPLETDLGTLERLREEGYPSLLLDIPRALFGEEKRTVQKMEQCIAAGFDKFVCGNLGALELVRQLGGEAHGGFSLNIFNTAALEQFRELGLSTAELSFELTARETADLGGTLPRGLMVYGRAPLMLTRNCPLANSPKGCLHCKEPGCLTDRKRKKFPVVCRGGRNVEVLNSVPLWLCDLGKELFHLDFGVARFTVENSVECGKVLDACFRGETPDFDYTRGLFHRGVE
jgi:putative protease